MTTIPRVPQARVLNEACDALHSPVLSCGCGSHGAVLGLPKSLPQVQLDLCCLIRSGKGARNCWLLSSLPPSQSQCTLPLPALLPLSAFHTPSPTRAALPYCSSAFLLAYPPWQSTNVQEAALACPLVQHAAFTRCSNGFDNCPKECTFCQRIVPIGLGCQLLPNSFWGTMLQVLLGQL